MAKFVLNGGTHVDGFGRKYHKGDVIESPSDLTKIFRGKFLRYSAEAVAETRPAPKPVKAAVEQDVPTPVQPADTAGSASSEPALPASKPEEGKKVAPAAATDKGKDVTSHFRKAVDEDFLVFKKGTSAYHVYDADNPEVPLNEVPLTKAKVNSFIKQHLEK